MSKFLLGLVLGIGLFLAPEYLFVAEGGLYMGTQGKPLPMEEHLAHKAIMASAAKGRAGSVARARGRDQSSRRRSRYQQGRAGCHSRLDQDDSVGATHWVVKNGIRSAPNTTLATTTARTITANLKIDDGRSRKL